MADGTKLSEKAQARPPIEGGAGAECVQVLPGGDVREIKMQDGGVLKQLTQPARLWVWDEGEWWMERKPRTLKVNFAGGSVDSASVMEPGWYQLVATFQVEGDEIGVRAKARPRLVRVA